MENILFQSESCFLNVLFVFLISSFLISDVYFVKKNVFSLCRVPLSSNDRVGCITDDFWFHEVPLTNYQY